MPTGRKVDNSSPASGAGPNGVFGSGRHMGFNGAGVNGVQRLVGRGADVGHTHRPPWLRRLSSTNQAKSLISIIILSLACSPHTGTNAKDYFVYASQRLPASRATPCQLFLGDVDCCHRLGAPN
jgi:hypothetical protein